MKKENIARFYYVMIFLVSPLYMSHGFLDILDAKAYAVWLSVAATSVIALYALVMNSLKKDKDVPPKPVKETVTDFFKCLDITDICVMVFGVVCIISALISDEVKEAFTGELAWHVGALMLVALGIMYFLTSRTMKMELIPLYVIIAGGFIIMVIGLLNNLWIDPLGAMATTDEYWKDTYTSTVGNVNTYSGYLSMVVPVAMMLFVLEKRVAVKIALGIVLVAGYMSMFLTHAGSLFVGLGVPAVVLVWFCLQDKDRYMGLLINGILCAVSGYAARAFIMLRPEIRLDKVSPWLLGHKVDVIIGAASFVLLLIHLALDNRMKDELQGKILRLVSRLYLIPVACAVIFAVYYTVKNWDYYFLNRRGLIWTIAFDIFKDGFLENWLFGNGTGLLDEYVGSWIVTINECYGGPYFLRHAHNDFVEYLAMTGILGFASFTGMFIHSFVKYIRRPHEDDVKFVLESCAVLGIVGYMAQAMLNGPHPLTTAMLFALFAISRGVTIGEGLFNKNRTGRG